MNGEKNNCITKLFSGCIYTEYENGFLTFDYYLSKNHPNIRLMTIVDNICYYSAYINNNEGLHSITIPWKYNLNNTYLSSGTWLEYDFELISCLPLSYNTNSQYFRKIFYNSINYIK